MLLTPHYPQNMNKSTTDNVMQTERQSIDPPLLSVVWLYQIYSVGQENLQRLIACCATVGSKPWTVRSEQSVHAYSSSAL